MLVRMRRRTAPTRGVRFCDECGQVRTSQYRARARLERIRAEFARQGFPR